MNISWNDLNNVQEAGGYPFRDGTITVTFAEIATWKKNPAARFELMRKHPVRTSFAYVLGKQIDERVPAEPIYESSNGDSWSLTADPDTGVPAVMHRPTFQSGGRISYIAVDQFLSEGADGPEHQALRSLLETTSRQATILIAYDVHPLRGEGYERLIAELRLLGTWWHHLETVWIVRSQHTIGAISSRLKSLIGPEDQLLVVDISGDTARWIGINQSGSKWLAEISKLSIAS
jgi:hypothetical protein